MVYGSNTAMQYNNVVIITNQFDKWILGLMELLKTQITKYLLLVYHGSFFLSGGPRSLLLEKTLQFSRAILKTDK